MAINAGQAGQIAVVLLFSCKGAPLPEGEKELDIVLADSGAGAEAVEEELESEGADTGLPDTGQAGGNSGSEAEATGDEVCYQ